MNEYVENECTRCEEGRVHVGGPREARTGPCPDCHGTSKILSYLYPRPNGRRGRWPPEGSVTEGRPDGRLREEGRG